MPDYNSGQRLLQFLEILKKETDENHFITMKDIQEHMKIHFKNKGGLSNDSQCNY